MQNTKAIIIGSGVAGLAIAIRLASKGYEVIVFEKNDYPGGKIAAFQKDGFHFDAGPSLFTQPNNIEELFALSGEPIENYFSFQKLNIACKYFYENGKQVLAYTDLPAFAEEMKLQLNEDPLTVTSYLKRAEKLYESIGKLFLGHSLHLRQTWLNKKARKAFSALRFPYLFQTLHRYNTKSFASREAVQLFDRFATYNGSNPYKTPAMLSLIPHLEQNQGTFYPTGGMISITDALFRLAKKKGVVFHFDSSVQRIINHEGRARGVVVKHKNIPADIVVSNSDVYYTYRDLLSDPVSSKKLLKQQRSSSAVIFYWGISKKFAALGLHNIFFSKDYKQEFDYIFKKGRLSEDPTVYINITSKMDPAHAPPGYENWFVMVNAPADSGQNWGELVSRLRSNVIDKLNRMLGTDLEKLILTEHITDPLIIQEETASYKGSLYGTSSNSRWAAFFRHANFDAGIKGLYFCGGSVHPGGGIPLCLQSAKIVSSFIATAGNPSLNR